MARTRGFAWTAEDHDALSPADTWGDVLVELARADPRLVAVTADLAATTRLARLRAEMPDRCVDVGLAEQNLVAVACGLAATGMVPVVFVRATQALRAADMVRTAVAYDARDVTIVGLFAGVAAGQGGPPHHACEDVALMRAVPGMVVLSPCDGEEMGAALRAAIAHEGPVYLRYGRGTEAPLRRGAPFRIGEPVRLREGADATVIATGAAVHHAVRAAERAAGSGIETEVLAMPTIKPLDEAAVLRAARATKRVVTVEDHSVVGGLGSAVADVLATSNVDCELVKLGHPDRWLGSGIPEDLMHEAGFDEDAVASALFAFAGVPPAYDDDWEERA